MRKLSIIGLLLTFALSSFAEDAAKPPEAATAKVSKKNKAEKKEDHKPSAAN